MYQSEQNAHTGIYFVHHEYIYFKGLSTLVLMLGNSYKKLKNGVKLGGS